MRLFTYIVIQDTGVRAKPVLRLLHARLLQATGPPQRGAGGWVIRSPGKQVAGGNRHRSLHVEIKRARSW